MTFSLSGPRSDAPTYDVAIVGSGPAGTTAGIYAARARLKAILIDKANLGGALGITSRIANYPGIGYDREMSGADLLSLMHEHARAFGVEFLQTQVFGLDLSGEIKEIYTSDRTVRSKTVILATGAGSRENKLPGEEEFLGRGVSYCAICDAAFYNGKTAAVLGSSQETVEEALVLSKFASGVFVFNPTPQFVADAEAVEQLTESPGVQVRYRHRALAIEGGDTVKTLRLRGPEGEVSFAVDGVFVYLPGNKPATGFLEGTLELDERGFIHTDAHLATSVPGVFAAGDVRGADVQQVVIACADGCIAALSADKHINKRERARSQH
ncbi:MAG: NAD(P)/FAD-dependent oxidoreductase [Chloroflexota bacterium]